MSMLCMLSYLLGVEPLSSPWGMMGLQANLCSVFLAQELTR